jgi:hypothetical protein
MKAILVCGLVAKFLASSAWQVAQVSAPTNSACVAGVAGAIRVAGAAGVAGAVWALAGSGGATNADAHSKPAASRNSKDACGPDCFRRARALGNLGNSLAKNLGNRVTGLSVRIENTAIE